MRRQSLNFDLETLDIATTLRSDFTKITIADGRDVGDREFMREASHKATLVETVSLKFSLAPSCVKLEGKVPVLEMVEGVAEGDVEIGDVTMWSRRWYELGSCQLSTRQT